MNKYYLQQTLSSIFLPHAQHSKTAPSRKTLKLAFTLRDCFVAVPPSRNYKKNCSISEAVFLSMIYVL
jgi:hypothetical protein